MPPRTGRRGSVALSMLDNQSLAPRLESVLSSTNPPSEDAACQVRCGLHGRIVLVFVSLVLLFFVVDCCRCATDASGVSPLAGSISCQRTTERLCSI